MSVQISEVAYKSDGYEALLKLRYEILRKPLGIELSAKDIATDHKEFHIAAFKNETAVGCVLLRPISTDAIRLRQMAVCDACQGQGIGAKLVTFAEKIASARGFKTIEIHARITAQGFYTKLGYFTEGEAFIEATVANIKMIKSLRAA